MNIPKALLQHVKNNFWYISLPAIIVIVLVTVFLYVETLQQPEPFQYTLF